MLKKFLKIIFKILIFIIVSLIGFILLIHIGAGLVNVQSDYCIEDGDCKEGRIIYVNENKILINKDNCLKNNWDWHEKSKICKITDIQFKVKEVIYDR